MGDKIFVEIMNGPEDGRLVPCGQTRISIGRADDNTVRLAFDHLISRHHALLRLSENNFVLSDLNSTNGTFVGKERVVEDTAIAIGKLFRVGATVLRIKIGASDQPPVDEEEEEQ